MHIHKIYFIMHKATIKHWPPEPAKWNFKLHQRAIKSKFKFLPDSKWFNQLLRCALCVFPKLAWPIPLSVFAVIKVGCCLAVIYFHRWFRFNVGDFPFDFVSYTLWQCVNLHFPYRHISHNLTSYKDRGRAHGWEVLALQGACVGERKLSKAEVA